MAQVPILDLSGCDEPPSAEVVGEVADAATRFGFFQVVNHGIPDSQIEQLWAATRAFFAEPTEVKRQISRTKDNSRGYYDRELTKNARDQKEVLDIAHVPFPDRADDDPAKSKVRGNRGNCDSLQNKCEAPEAMIYCTTCGTKVRPRASIRGAAPSIPVPRIAASACKSSRRIVRTRPLKSWRCT